MAIDDPMFETKVISIFKYTAADGKGAMVYPACCQGGFQG